MKDIRPALRSLLLDDVDVSSIVVTRVYPVVLPQGVTDPSIVYNIVTESTDYNLSGPSGLKTARLQIDCVARAPDLAVELAIHVKNVLSGFSGTVDPNSIVIRGIFHVQGRGHYDSVAKLHTSRHEYLVWYLAVDSTTQEHLSLSSAGVFDSDGALVRTLWSSVENHEAPEWDGLLDDTSIAPTGTYTIRVLSHNVRYAWEGVIGNSSPMSQHDTLTYHNEAASVLDMEITDAGEMYYVSGYNERWPVAHVTTTADPQVTEYGIMPLSFRTTHGALQAVCTDGTYAYYARAPIGAETHGYIIGVSCVDKTLITFPSGTAIHGYSGIAYSTGGGGTPFISGIAVQKTGDFLFVARVVANEVLTVNKTSGATLQTDVGFTFPYLMAVSPTTENLWLVNGSPSLVVTELSADGSGNLTPTGVEITGAGNIQGIDISPDGTTILLADATTHQVRAFNASDGSVKTAFGTSGVFGIAGGYATTPVISTTRFMFEVRSLFSGKPAYVAYAPDGSWWLGDSGNYRSLHFSAGNAPIYIEQIAYMSANYSCRVCKNDPTRVFADYLEYTIDYDQPLESGWTLTYNWSGNLASLGLAAATNTFRRMQHVGTYVDGRTYAIYADIALANFKWCELTATGPRDTGVLWHPNIMYVDEQFNLWHTEEKPAGFTSAIYKNPFTGLDGSNNPTWTYGTMSTTGWDLILSIPTMPPLFPGTDMTEPTQDFAHVEPTENGIIPMINVGPDPTINHLGGIDATTGAVKFSTWPSPTDRIGGRSLLLLTKPEKPFYHAGLITGTVYSGGPFLYKPGHATFFTNSCGEGWGQNQTNVWDHWHDSGLMVNRFGPVAPYFASRALLNPDAAGDGIPSAHLSFKGMAELAGNTRWGGIAYVGGKYYLYQNDEWYHGGTHRWRVENLNSIQIETVDTVAWDSGSYVAVSDPTDMLEGLAFNAGHVDGTAGWFRVPAMDVLTNPPWSKVYTNAINCSPHRSPDLVFECELVAPFIGTTNYVYKALPRVGVGNWTVDARAHLQMGVGTTINASTRIAFRILDNTGKVLLVLYNWTDLSVFSGCNVNEIELTTPTTALIWGSYCEQVLPLVVTGNVGSGLLEVTYGDFTVSRSVYEGGADIVQPARVELEYRNVEQRFMSASITELYFTEA